VTARQGNDRAHSSPGEKAEEDAEQKPTPRKGKRPEARREVTWLAPLQVRAAWDMLSLHVGGKEAAHHTADEAAE